MNAGQLAEGEEAEAGIFKPATRRKSLSAVEVQLPALRKADDPACVQRLVKLE